MSKSSEITLEEAKAVILAHREAEYAAKATEATKLLGRYFKYRNTYGGDGAKKWWLYAAPTVVSEIGSVSALTFQHTSDGTIDIRVNDSLHVGSGGWLEIDPSEFWKAALEIRTEAVRRLSPAFHERG